MKWCFPICLAGILLACSDLQRPEQLDKVMEIITALDSMEVALNETGGDRLEEMLNASEAIELRVETVEPDTLPYDLAVRLDRFHRMGQEAAAVKEQLGQLQEVVAGRKKRAKELKNDIEKGSGRRDRYDEFIAFEEEQLNLLRERIDNCRNRWEEAVHIFDELNVILPKELDERFGEPEVH